MSKKINFTKESINNLPIPNDKQAVYYDVKQRGLCVIITYGGSKTFYLYTKINNIPIRVKLGKFPELSIEEARKLASTYKNQTDKGINPNDEKKKLRLDMTLNRFYEDIYKPQHQAINKKPNSIRTEEATFKKHIKNTIGNKKMLSITRTDVEKLRNNLIKDKSKPHVANRTLAFIRGLYNKAKEWNYPGENPASLIKPLRENMRIRYITPEEFPVFYEAVEKEQNLFLKYYILLSLYTGQRQANILAMKWDQIDFHLKNWIIPETKNGTSFTKQLDETSLTILNHLKELSNNSEWVFPNPRNKSGHLQDPKKAWKRLKTNAGLENLRPHDLRHTYLTYLANNGASLPIIQSAGNHKTMQAAQRYIHIMQSPVIEASNNAINVMLSYKKEKK